MRLECRIKSEEISADVDLRLMAAGAKIAVGADDAASNGGQNIFESIKCAALLARCGTADPAEWLTAGQAMTLAVDGGRDIFALARGIAPNAVADLGCFRSPRTRLTRFSIRCDNCTMALGRGRAMSWWQASRSSSTARLLLSTYWLCKRSCGKSARSSFPLTKDVRS
jgi:cytosine/adenosine deaminase-related metal-dependent hydrolase